MLGEGSLNTVVTRRASVIIVERLLSTSPPHQQQQDQLAAAILIEVRTRIVLVYVVVKFGCQLRSHWWAGLSEQPHQ
jgi:hypothetical protein